MELKQYRLNTGISIKEASKTTGVPIRTYIRYENDNSYGNKLKRNAMLEMLKQKYDITEDKGFLTIKQIQVIINDVFKDYENKIDFCYLFGSYAKWYATETSDIDLFISTSIFGLAFLGLIEKLRSALRKKVDLIRLSDLSNNEELLKEIIKDGVRIYS